MIGAHIFFFLFLPFFQPLFILLSSILSYPSQIWKGNERTKKEPGGKERKENTRRASVQPHSLKRKEKMNEQKPERIKIIRAGVNKWGGFHPFSCFLPCLVATQTTWLPPSIPNHSHWLPATFLAPIAMPRSYGASPPLLHDHPSVLTLSTTCFCRFLKFPIPRMVRGCNCSRTHSDHQLSGEIAYRVGASNQ